MRDLTYRETREIKEGVYAAVRFLGGRVAREAIRELEEHELPANKRLLVIHIECAVLNALERLTRRRVTRRYLVARLETEYRP